MLTLAQRISAAWRLLRAKNCNTIEHAAKELGFMDTPDKMGQAMRTGLLELVTLFSTQGHSGFSAAWCRSRLDALLAFKPLGPITGDDSEWTDVNEDKDTGDMLYQNKRAPNLFRELPCIQHVRGFSFGPPIDYIIDGFTFEYPDGTRVNGPGSRRRVELPGHLPKTIMVKIQEDATEEDRLRLAAQALAEPALPSWYELSTDKGAGKELTALEQFIYDNEPAGIENGADAAADFRASLAAVIKELRA